MGRVCVSLGAALECYVAGIPADFPSLKSWSSRWRSSMDCRRASLLIVMDSSNVPVSDAGPVPWYTANWVEVFYPFLALGAPSLYQ